MKTILVCSERNINKYVGLFFDSIIEVLHQPTTKTINDDLDIIKREIEKLSEDDKQIEVFLDAGSPYSCALINFKILFKDLGIDIELPHLKSLNYDLEKRAARALELIEEEKKRRV